MKQGYKERIVIYSSVCIMGGCGLAYEYTLSKVSSDILGNGPRQWAIVIGMMMFFMGIGSDVQKYLKDKNLVDQFIAFEILLGLLGGIGPIVILYTYGAFYSHFVLVQYTFIGGIGFLIGLEIPLLARINEAYTEELRYNLGGILKMDYIGALCGAMAWIFVLPKFFTLMEIATFLGMVTMLTSAVAYWAFYQRIVYRISILTLLLAVSCLLSFTFIHAERWTTHAEQYLYRDKIILSTTTIYQHIVLTESTTGTISCYINGHLQFNSRDEHIYHELLVHPVMSIVPHRQRILVLGGGDGLAVREILKYPDVRSITLVDIDPEMTKLASTNVIFRSLNQDSLVNRNVITLKNNALEESSEKTVIIPNRRSKFLSSGEAVAKVRIINIDAVKFLEQIPGVFDVIIVDFPDPNSPELARLYSHVFYQYIKKKLAPGGMFVQQATSPIHAKEAFLCIGRTMEHAGLSILPYHDNIPSFGEWGWWIGGDSMQMKKSTIKKQIQHIDTLSVPTFYLIPEIVKGSFVFGKGQLESSNTGITSLTNSQVYNYYFQGWLEE